MATLYDAMDDSLPKKKLRLCSKSNYVPTSNAFGTLADSCIMHVCTYLMPIEVFHLCQTSRIYHLNESQLAKNMMNASLTLSLDQALQRNKVGFRVADLKRLNSLIKKRNLPPFSVALSGSIVLQACLCKPFGIKNTDADLFCSSDALHVVRDWLVDSKKCNMVFHRLKERTYTSDLNSFLEKDIGGERVHHVEAYGPMPSMSQMKENDVCVSNDHNKLNRCIWKWKEKKRQRSEQSGSCRGPPLPGYDFTPLSDVKFSFLRPTWQEEDLYSDSDSDGCSIDSYYGNNGELALTNSIECTVDLVVSKRGKSSLSLINTFDLDICMCSYDGETFIIQNPSYVFNSTKVGNKLVPLPLSNITRNADVLSDFFMGWNGEVSTEERLNKLKREGAMNALLRYVQDPTFPLHRSFVFSNPKLEEQSRYNDRIYEAHRLIQRAVDRINKYRVRGISVLNSNHIPSEYPAEAFDNEKYRFYEILGSPEPHEY